MTSRKGIPKAAEGPATAAASPAPVPASPSKAERLAKRASLQGALSMSIASAILRITSGEGDADGDDIAATCADQMMCQAFTDLQPTSQLERMLIEQMVMTHAQIIMANHRATGERMDPERRAEALAVTSRLMADFRKSILALKEWRAPVRQFIVAQQVNQAAQQTITGPGTSQPNSENLKSAASPTIEVGTQDGP